MKTFHPPVWPVALVLLAASLLPGAAVAVLPNATPPPATSVPPGGGRLLLEVGWAAPLGDLADGLDETPAGSGSLPGVELGARWRFALSPRWSLGPAVHFLDYGDASGLGTSGEEGLASAALIYSLELLVTARDGRVRPFAGLAPGVMHRRLSGPGKDHVTLVEDTHTGLGLSARVGVRLQSFEISAVYHVDRFASYGFFASGRELDYNWDTAVLRIGWLLP